MTYDELYNMIVAKHPLEGIPAPRPYHTLVLDNRNGHIVPLGRWYLQIGRRDKYSLHHLIDDHYEKWDTLRFLPGNICLIPGVPVNTFCLAGFNIAAKFEARKSIRSEYIYVHDWYTKYECVPNMQLRMSDGKPLNARRLDQLRIHKAKLKMVRAQLAKKKAVYLSCIKLGSRDRSNTERIRPYTNVEDRREAWAAFFSDDGNRGWLETFTRESNAFDYDNKFDRESYAKAFDRMWRYDQAAVFRTLGVTY